MTAPESHFKETKEIAQKLNSTDIAIWLLNEGYYPEQYVVPPCFKVKDAVLFSKPFYDSKEMLGIEPVEMETISFPKSNLIDRTFGIYDFKIYHDIVWHITNEWQTIFDLLFSEENRIFSYSFPIPITSKNPGLLNKLRSGRMIYEYITMAENDLLKESFKYKYILKTDIKNFYPSIYTHSIAWAIHGKDTIRANGNRRNMQFLGNKLDTLMQKGNDGCTNGIAIGPAISDLISEIILTSVGKESSQELVERKIDCIGVRYKDDYRFLCNSNDDAHKILKIIQRNLYKYNLVLNEGKSIVNILPEGLFRAWKKEYTKCSLKEEKTISYPTFESAVLNVLEINKENPETGVIDKFLGELTDKYGKLKVNVSNKNVLKFISLLTHLKERRPKSFPQIIAIIECIYKNETTKEDVKETIKSAAKKQFDILTKDPQKNLYELLWLSYFIRSNNLFRLELPKDITSKFLLSIQSDEQRLLPYCDFNIYQSIDSYTSNNTLLDYLAIFNKSKKKS